MADKHLVCKGATVYCNKSMVNNSPGTAVPLNITSQTLVVINGDKVAATDKDNTPANMCFGTCKTGSNPPPPCVANVQWGKFHEDAEVTGAGLKFLTEESEATCMAFGGKVKIAYHGQIATPQPEELDEVSRDVMAAILPVIPEKEEDIAISELGDNPNKQARIESIEILDDTGKPVTGNYKKYVNLRREHKFVDGKEIKGLYQLGNDISCKVKFNEGGCHDFKLSIVPHGSNLKYSAAEKGRNRNFNYQEAELDVKTGANGEVVVEAALFLDQAGDNKYHLQAKDGNGKTVKSVTITTRRKLYFVELKMKNLRGIAKSFSTFTNEFDKNLIKMDKLAEEPIDYIENIGSNTSRFLSSVKSGYNKHSEMSPYCVAIAYADQMAVKIGNMRIKGSVNSQKKIKMSIEDESNSIKYPLWNNVVAGEDWFISCEFIDSAGNKTAIGESKCAPVQNPDKPPYHYTKKGHNGNHCHSGLPVQASYKSDKDMQLSGCVMFGAANGHTAFCPDCAKCVKKTDISNGVG